MGALFLDGGLEPVRAFVRSRVMGEAAERLALELRSGAALGNYKSALAGAPAGGARRSTCLSREERERPRPPQAFSGRGAAERRSRRKGSRWPAAWDAPRSTPNRMQRAARWNLLRMGQCWRGHCRRPSNCWCWSLRFPAKRSPRQRRAALRQRPLRFSPVGALAQLRAHLPTLPQAWLRCCKPWCGAVCAHLCSAAASHSL
jgi:hypothetical protein